MLGIITLTLSREASQYFLILRNAQYNLSYREVKYKFTLAMETKLKSNNTIKKIMDEFKVLNNVFI